MKNYTNERAMALMRHLVLDALHSTYPVSYSRPALLKALGPSFPDHNRDWLNDAMSEQLQVLIYAGLIRPAAKGYTLTAKGLADRQQAARFLNKNTTPPEAA